MSEAVMTAFPPKIGAAIIKVMQSVGKLAKEDKNDHGNYKFASVDAFLEAVQPACADAGLIIIQDEESFSAADGWLTLTFRFGLAHESGEMWAQQPRRSIMVSSKMGAQAFGAAQSYALKQFMRALFQIPTGDREDADNHAPADLPTNTGRKLGEGREKKPEDFWGGPLKKTELKEAMRAFVSDLESCEDYDQHVGHFTTSDDWRK